MAAFAEKVYKIVSKIPRGKVMTYKQVAEAAGHPRAYRAVGNILNKNRNPKVPCHRVIKSNGDIGGYAWGIAKKMALLQKEMAVQCCSSTSSGTSNCKTVCVPTS